MPRLAALLAACLALVVLAVLALDPGADERPARAPQPAAAAPRMPAPAPPPAGVRGHLRALAGIAERTGGTRAAGTPGDRATARYLVERLRAAGYRVRTQRVTFRPRAGDVPADVRPAGGTALERGEDVAAMAGSGSGRASGPVRAIGLRPGRASAALCAPGDAAGIRRGDVVVVQRGTCTLREKVERAAGAGAGAVLVVNDGRPDRTGVFGGTLGPGRRIAVPALTASTAAGRTLARAGRAALRVEAARGTRATQNVIAEPPAPRRGLVLAGAHLDSVAVGPGLNDNGSGVAATLAAAEALRGRADVGFAFWGAEEVGLVGSRRFVREDGAAGGLRAYVNLDMVGTPDGRARLYGDGPVTRVLRAELEREGLEPGRTGLGSSSDHAPFAAAGVPVGGVFTGLDRCYHRACDDLDNVDAGLAGDVAAAVTRALPRLAAARRG